MREDARNFLGWNELTTEQAADFIGVSKRTWQRFEKPDEHKHMADSQIRLFWYEVALTKLEQTEEKEKVEGVRRLLPNDGELNIKNVFDYLYNAWERWDPVLKERS